MFRTNILVQWIPLRSATKSVVRTSLGGGWRSTFAAAAAAHSIRIHHLRNGEQSYHTSTQGTSRCKWGGKESLLRTQSLGMPPCLGNLQAAAIQTRVTRSTQLLPSSSPQQCPRLCHFPQPCTPDTDPVPNPTQPISDYSNIPCSLAAAIHILYHIRACHGPIQVCTNSTTAFLAVRPWTIMK